MSHGLWFKLARGDRIVSDGMGGDQLIHSVVWVAEYKNDGDWPELQTSCRTRIGSYEVSLTHAGLTCMACIAEDEPKPMPKGTNPCGEVELDNYGWSNQMSGASWEKCTFEEVKEAVDEFGRSRKNK